MPICAVNDVKVSWANDPPSLDKDYRYALSIAIKRGGEVINTELSDNDASDLIFALTRAKRDRHEQRKRLKHGT